jgi:hypothetical protein
MDHGKMKLGSAGFKDDIKADCVHPLKKGKVDNVVARPAGMKAAQGIEPIGKLSSTPLRMQGLK